MPAAVPGMAPNSIWASCRWWNAKSGMYGSRSAGLGSGRFKSPAKRGFIRQVFTFWETRRGEVDSMEAGEYALSEPDLSSLDGQGRFGVVESSG